MIVSSDDVKDCDVLFLPRPTYNPESGVGSFSPPPPLQFAVEGHPGNNRFFVTLISQRRRFMTAFETREYVVFKKIAKEIVSIICDDYKGRFLERDSMDTDSMWTDLGTGQKAIDRVEWSFLNPPQNHFTYLIEQGDEDSGDSLLSNMSSLFDDDDKEKNNNDALAFGSTLNSIPNSFQVRENVLETGSISSVDAVDTVSSISSSVESQGIITARKDPKKTSVSISLSTQTTRKDPQHKRTIQRRGKLRPGQSSKLFTKPTSDGQNTDITELLHACSSNSSNAYCESTESESKRQRRLGPPLDPSTLRSQWLKKLRLGGKHTNHYSASELDILESDEKVKCLNHNSYRDVSPFDVLCETKPTPGLIESNNMGNSRLKIMMQNHRSRYRSNDISIEEKQSIENLLVTEVVDGKGNGSFISRESERDDWLELNQEMSCSVVKGSLTESEYDLTVLDLPEWDISEPIVDCQYDQPWTKTEMEGLHSKALLSLQNRKKKKVPSSKLNPKSIEELQKQMSGNVERDDEP